MNDQLKKYLEVRYVKLHFHLRMMEFCELNVNKAYGLRGGMGRMLMEMSCIRDEKCDVCDFRDECTVRRIMYSPFSVKPSFVTEGESIGYNICCTDYRTSFGPGDELEFTMTLFGKTIVYFYQILQAFYRLGQKGLGSGHGTFEIIRVTNSKNESLVDGYNIYKERYKVMTLWDYVNYRLRRPKGTRMLFHTQAAIKYNGENLKEYNSEAIVRALARRLYMLDCYEGIEADRLAFSELPLITAQRTRTIKSQRYSSRQNQKLPMNGITGYVDFDEIEEDLYTLMLAGEIMQIGSKTSQGLGRYTMTDRE